MAGGSAKKVAAQNANAIKNLRIGLLVTCVSTLALRFIIFRRSHNLVQLFLIAFPFIPSLTIYNYLTKLGKPARNDSGSLLNPGGDLNQGGITEWAFDILYITWACQIGSALLGEWFNFLYLVIPAFGLYKLWGLASPFMGGGGSSNPAGDADQPQSKRQQKLQQRAERGDQRVKQMKR